MADVITVEGTVLEQFPGNTFKVQLEDSDNIIIGHLSGKMVMNKIRVLIGDSVTVELSPYNLTKGRIIFRSKK